MALEETPLVVDPDYAALRKACARLSADDSRQVDELLSLHGVASEYIEYSGSMAQIPMA